MSNLTFERGSATKARAAPYGLPWLRRYVPASLLFLATLALCQWGVPALGVPSFILPTPTQVLAAMLDPESTLLFHLMITAVRSGGGFALGALLGFGLAVLFVHVRPIEDALYPWVIVTQTVPLVAIAPLLVLWFGNGMLSRIVMSALFAFFPVLVNTSQGLRAVNRDMIDLLRSYNASRWQVFRLLRAPHALPYLFVGLKIGATLAVIGAIVAEFAGAGEGLGFMITISTYHLATDRTFAAVVAASCLGLGFHLLLLVLEQRLVFWQREVKG